MCKCGGKGLINNSSEQFLEDNIVDKIKREAEEDVKEIIEEVFENEVKIVRKCCLNILRTPLFGENLQDMVIFHLKNFKRNLIRKLEEVSE